MGIHVIRRLRRPDRTAVSGFTAYGCRVLLAGKHTARLASVEFLSLWDKNYARSLGAVPFVKKASAFLTVSVHITCDILRRIAGVVGKRKRKRHAVFRREPVSYTHLDVYKRQPQTVLHQILRFPPEPARRTPDKAAFLSSPCTRGTLPRVSPAHRAAAAPHSTDTPGLSCAARAAPTAERRNA